MSYVRMYLCTTILVVFLYLQQGAALDLWICTLTCNEFKDQQPGDNHPRAALCQNECFNSDCLDPCIAKQASFSTDLIKANYTKCVSNCKQNLG